MYKFIQNIFLQFNRINSSLLIFLLCASAYAVPDLIYNEEQYFAYAKHFINPDWIAGSFVLNDFAGSRILFQYLAGTLLKVMSFEQLAMWGRLINFALFAFAFAALFRLFKLKNHEILILMLAFFLPHQNFFAGEWIVGGFEGKTISYVFILWALYFLFREKPWPAIMMGAAATYWHLLVGGWFSLFVCLYFLVKNRKILQVLLMGLSWLAVLMPLLYYIAGGLIAGPGAVIDGVDTDQVYAFIRNPHHIGIFRSSEYFVHRHLGGVVLSMLALTCCIIFYRKYRDKDIRSLSLLNILIFSQQFLFLAIALFDTNGRLLKFYPFRSSALSSLLVLVELSIVIKRYGIPALEQYFARGRFRLGGRLIGFNLAFLAFGIGILLLLVELGGTVKSHILYASDPKRISIRQMADFLNRELKPPDTYLVLAESDHTLSLIRKSQRDAFFMDRFIPTTPALIYQWYKRREEKRKCLSDPSYLQQLKKQYGVRYVIHNKPLADAHVKLELKTASYWLYSIN